MKVGRLLKWLLGIGNSGSAKELKSSVKFSEWAGKNNWKYDTEHTRWNNEDAMDPKTTDELFKMFIQSGVKE